MCGTGTCSRREASCVVPERLDSHRSRQQHLARFRRPDRFARLHFDSQSNGNTNRRAFQPSNGNSRSKINKIPKLQN